MEQAAYFEASDGCKSKDDEKESILWADAMKHVGLRVNVRTVSADEEAVAAPAPATGFVGNVEDEAVSFVLEYRGRCLALHSRVYNKIQPPLPTPLPLRQG